MHCLFERPYTVFNCFAPRRVLGVHRLCIAFLYGVALSWIALHRAGSSECTTRALPFCTALHCICSLFTPRGVLLVHRTCTAFLYGFTLPLFSFCTARGPHSATPGLLSFFVSCCTALGYFCTAWCSGSALLAYFLFYQVALPWIAFAPCGVQTVLYRGAQFFSFLMTQR
jgi:hypothetical protein